MGLRKKGRRKLDGGEGKKERKGVKTGFGGGEEIKKEEKEGKEEGREKRGKRECRNRERSERKEKGRAGGKKA